jgi:ABC-type branched-subunit amino acid transport system permease subunit
MAQPYQKSNLAKVITVFGALASAVVSIILKEVIKNKGFYIIAVVYFGTLAIFLMIIVVRGIWKVFRPDDAADLSLK